MPASVDIEQHQKYKMAAVKPEVLVARRMNDRHEIPTAIPKFSGSPS
jgi:hypothetical protein